MKRFAVIFLLLLALISISVSSAVASGKGTAPAASVAILGCAVPSATPTEFQVSFYSGPSTISVKATDDCSTDLATILNAGYRLQDVRVVNGVEVYTLLSGFVF